MDTPMEPIYIAFLILFFMVLMAIPPLIAKKRGASFYYWWLATAVTGFVPGVVASILHRKWGFTALKGFIWGALGYLALGWIIFFGIAYLVE
jgi:hypothetical protein